ncbi:hypothetical protein [Nocardioides sp. GXZ039]|uniref:hypothetical protein n=1 Tax=Nocardioides sp. GXZ039 TaxID=3136018 RepID=UPI0030F49B2E
MTRLVPSTRRARVWVALAVGVIVLVAVSPAFGRADVTGNYRPVLPPDGLTTGCYPLPGGVVPDFEYVLRRDGDTVGGHGLRRRTVLHVDRIDAAEARERLLAQFAAAGVDGGVRIEAHDFEGIADDAVVRGELVLDLPVVSRQSASSECDDVFSTKRFTPDLTDRS